MGPCHPWPEYTVLQCYLCCFCMFVFAHVSTVISVRCIHGLISTLRKWRMLLTSMRFSMAISLSMRKVSFQDFLFIAYAVNLQLGVSDKHLYSGGYMFCLQNWLAHVCLTKEIILKHRDSVQGTCGICSPSTCAKTSIQEGCQGGYYPERQASNEAWLTSWVLASFYWKVVAQSSSWQGFDSGRLFWDNIIAWCWVCCPKFWSASDVR
jgi:hypothetical protein